MTACEKERKPALMHPTIDAGLTVCSKNDMRLILIVFLGFSEILWASPSQKLEIEARESIHNYFSTSNRALKSLRWVDLSLLDRQKQEYLVEAEVIAQRVAYSDLFSFYHCGVFTRRVSRQDWEINLTACEAFAEANTPSF